MISRLHADSTLILEDMRIGVERVAPPFRDKSTLTNSQNRPHSGLLALLWREAFPGLTSYDQERPPEQKDDHAVR